MHYLDLFGTVNTWSLRLPLPVALAAVAAIGYLVGRWNRQLQAMTTVGPRRELRRAQAVARELERIAWRIRKDLARHHASVNKFKSRVGGLDNQQQEAAWKELCQEADEMLSSTLQLVTQIASAHDQLRQQTNHLLSFSEVRVDPLTGVNNRRGLDDALAIHFAMLSRYQQKFSVAIFDIDHFKRINDEQGHLQGDQMLQRFAKLLDDCVRETDTVARYGGEEFVVLMPQTNLEGGCTFADRFRAKAAEVLPLTISGGVTVALDGDTPSTLLARADAALYAAKSAGRNRVFRHTGEHIESALEVVVSGVVASSGVTEPVACAALPSVAVLSESGLGKV